MNNNKTINHRKSETECYINASNAWNVFHGYISNYNTIKHNDEKYYEKRN